MWNSARVSNWSFSFQYKHLWHLVLKNSNVILPAILTPDTCDTDLYNVLSKLENCTDSLFTWLKEYCIFTV